MSDYTIHESTEEERDFIGEAIVPFNASQVPFTQEPHFIPMNIVAKNEKNEPIGGINAVLYCWGVLYVDILWVHDTWRGKGLGSELMRDVEARAKKLGCYMIHLDTFDFQAKDFYQKLGFEVFGVMEDCPPGHKDTI